MKYKILLTIVFLLILSAWVYNTKFKNDDDKVARILMFDLEKGLEVYKKDCGSYPSSRQGLVALVKKPEDLQCPNYNSKKYLGGLDFIPQDPNNQDFIYTSDGLSFKLKRQKK